MEVMLTYTNPLGRSVTFYTRKQGGEHPPYLMQYITGVGGVSPEYESVSLTGNDGSSLGDVRFPSRSIQTGLMIYGRNDNERDQNLKQLLAIINPRMGMGTLTYQNHEGTYTTEGRPQVLPSFSASTKQGSWKPVMIDYECPHPFFQGLSAFSALVAVSNANFTLPFRLPFRLGNQKYRAEASNLSDIPVPVRIIITGPAENPVLTNETTGDSMRVRKQLLVGETLTIETGPAIAVTIRNARGAVSDALNYVDLLGSQWVYLMPGANMLTYSSDDGTRNTRIEVHWNDWYQGVG